MQRVATHTKIRLSAALAVPALWLAMGAAAQAQSAPSVTLGQSPLQQYGQLLANDGITINSRYNGEFAANPSAAMMAVSNSAMVDTLDELTGIICSSSTIDIVFDPRSFRMPGARSTPVTQRA